ncbi:peptidyl-prolyl cis-trans cyclophilin-type [Micractinium conductrix]|uniref:Peptidyl-prolyl cis-trans cyclophilin-type n=1 Tax=Micractinium conductrix TaxID=554055 RepID=A0A2P6VPE2_9CHLO|nr:peptidyl-prolyl cis-trans cyclophilin-type [Micractinium conductrix]|eukprot:PSC75966.1 peptidyl-prolyl cis-trans cyclophilin-type [Micractinium conductrix]
MDAAGGGAGGTDGGSQGCNVLRETNLQGSVLEHLQGVPDAASCCGQCQQDPGCNVWVYCQSAGGCGDWPYRLCTLKRQPVGAGGRPMLVSYGAGPGVPWTSGYIVQGDGAGGGSPSGPQPQRAVPPSPAGAGDLRGAPPAGQAPSATQAVQLLPGL